MPSLFHLLDPAPALPVSLRIPRPCVDTTTAGTSAANLLGFQNAVSADIDRLQDSATVAGFVTSDAPDVVGGGEQW